MASTDKFFEIPQASDRIVEFYLDHRSLLLDASMSRNSASNEKRKTLQKTLIEELGLIFGIPCSFNKIKYHFDNRKCKIVKKYHETKDKQMKAGIRWDDDPTKVFTNPTDLRLWDYLSKPPPIPGEDDGLKIVKDENIQNDSLECLLKRNGVVLNSEKKSILNKDSLTWDNFNSKLILPNAASDYVVEFYLENSSILLENTNSRSSSVNVERKQKMNELVTGIQQKFGIVTDIHKMKTHFDNRKARVMRRGFDHAMRSQENIEEQFESEVDRKLWTRFKDSHFKEKKETDKRTAEQNDIFNKEIKTEVPDIIEGAPINLELFQDMSGSSQQSLTLSSENEKSRKRPCTSDDNDSQPTKEMRFVSEDELRAKQYELVEKQIRFYNENLKLVTTLVSAVSTLFEKIESLSPLK